jgi:flagellar protein FlaH
MSNDDLINVEIKRDELHRRLGGGIPLGSLMLIEGKYGFGKSIICQRLLYGALSHDTKVTYISNELSTKDFIRQMESVKYDVTEFLLDQKLLFIPMFPLLGQVVFRKDLINRLMDSKELFANDLIVIDTLSFLIVQDNAAEKKCFEVMKFFKMMADLDKTVIFTADPEHLNMNLLTLVRSMCDIHFELTQKTIGGDVKRLISVNRFKRSRELVQPIIPFRVEPNEGLGIEISSMV